MLCALRFTFSRYGFPQRQVLPGPREALCMISNCISDFPRIYTVRNSATSAYNQLYPRLRDSLPFLNLRQDPAECQYVCVQDYASTRHYSRGVWLVSATGKSQVGDMLRLLPGPLLVHQGRLDSGRLIGKVMEPCVPGRSSKGIPTGQVEVVLPARLNLRATKRSVLRQQSIVLWVDVRIIVEFLIFNPFGSYCHQSAKISPEFPPVSDTYEAAPPYCSRRTCCRSDRFPLGYQPWCHLEVGELRAVDCTGSRGANQSPMSPVSKESLEQSLLGQNCLFTVETRLLTSICQKYCFGPMRHKLRRVRVGVDMTLQLKGDRQRGRLSSAAIRQKVVD
jgi:hypothetical protein